MIGGPGAGTAFPLSVGTHVVGRGSEAGVCLPDPDVSRRHAVIGVGAGGITVADVGSTNGTLMNGTAVGPDPLAWPGGSVLRVGATALTVRGPRTRPVVTGPAPGGRLVVSPVPASAVGRPDREVVFPPPPAAVQHRRMAWAAVGLPAAAGLAMALLLHAPQYLFIAGLSPVVAISGWWSDRRSGRRTHRREVAAHGEAVRAAELTLAEAVAADVRSAEAAAPDLALLTSAARRRSAPLWSRRAEDPEALAVRLGTGPGPTRVTRREGTGTAVHEHAPSLPVLVDLRTDGGLGVVGPRVVALEVLSAVIAQLAALHAPGVLDLLLLAPVERLPEWSWARWLPHLRILAGTTEAETVLSALTAAAGVRFPEGPRRWTVLVLDDSASPSLLARLREARASGVVVLTSAPTSEELPATGGAVLCSTGEVGTAASLTRQGGTSTCAVLVDRLGRGPAALLARDLAPLCAPTAEGSLPTRVRLLDLPAPGLRLEESGRLTGQWSSDRGSLVATLGCTADGPVTLDLCAVGPHALVAGTTGAGKSELVQTLIAGLALRHPPDRCSFLLVDYKGGAAFAEAAGLPHTVGMLTDLDAGSTARALRSLTAELSRREALLAEHSATDIADLPAAVQLSRLVIVVDEFAGLAEELPAFVPGLVGIAQRGRSLGVHLVLATQRPGGVVSPEIRANCTLRICLRTTDEGDSRDVLGTPDAAHLPVDVPGRAYLRVGSGPPTLFQVARVSAAPEPAPPGAVVRPRPWPYAGVEPAGTPQSSGPSDLARSVAALSTWAPRCGVSEPHRPWLPPLPDRLTLDQLPTGAPARSPGRVVLGLLDRPAAQRQQPLYLDLAEGGGWLVAGGPRSGRTTALRTVLAQAVTGASVEEVHVHVLDHGGGALAAEAAHLPHTGTVVTGEDVLRSVRLLDRLAQEITARRAGGNSRPEARLLLLVDGVESLMAQLDEVDPVRGSGAFLRLVRDGGAAGLTCVLTADRAVPGARLAGAVARRLVLPLADRADYAVAGIPTTAVPEHRPPGRAVLAEEALEVQLVLPPPLPELHARAPRAGGPLCIPELAPDPLLLGGMEDLRLRIGPGGDEGAPLTVDLSRNGGLLVVGPPGSGRSSALTAFAGDLSSAGVPVLRVEHRRSAGGLPWASPGDLDAVRGWLDELQGRTGVLIADDLGPAADWPVLSALPGGARAGDVVVIAAGTAADLSGHYQGVIAGLRRSRSGLLLLPGPGEAELLGIRLPRAALPVRPGSGWLVTNGEATRVQVARRRPAQRRSSIGPSSCVAYQASS